MVPSPTPYGLPFHKIGVRTLPKNPIAIISGTGKAANFKYGQYIQRVHPNKSPLKILEKWERGRIHGLPNFCGSPYYLRNGKSHGFQIWPSTFSLRSRVYPSKSPLKILEKRGVGVSRDCPILSGTPYYLRNGKSYGFQIWPVHSEGPSEQISPLKIFREKGAWAYPGTAHFWVPAIIS